eukprot:gene32106-42852_t
MRYLAASDSRTRRAIAFRFRRSHTPPVIAGGGMVSAHAAYSERQFTPVEGGYLYYPSKKGGGKLVTSDEYHDLVDGWRKIVGRSGMRKIVGVAMLAIFGWTLISKTLSLPDWWDSLSTAAFVASISLWLLWASFAPRRLVRDRPNVAPPRAPEQAGREVRALVDWPFVIFALSISALTFFGSLYATPRDFASWAWLIGSGAMFGGYVWIAMRKMRDR